MKVEVGNDVLLAKKNTSNLKHIRQAMSDLTSIQSNGEHGDTINKEEFIAENKSATSLNKYEIFF